ncbi:hypothetical protein SAMN05428951_12331 [Pseudomonas sp. OV546]|nr:hypothetical protein SAMN05428951_12331 [Pseudomonas sp. OV546]
MTGEKGKSFSGLEVKCTQNVGGGLPPMAVVQPIHY